MDARFVFIFVAALRIVQTGEPLNSCEDVKAFVNGHNDRRLKIAKGEIHGQQAASTMPMVIWDDELATKAQNWASKDTYRHNPDKTIPSGRFKTGENIYWYATTDDEDSTNYIVKAMDSWWGENEYYNYGPMFMKDFDISRPKIGHFTQMVWADSTRIGCGVSKYSDDGWTNYLVVCNYGPAGNFMGEAPYTVGDGVDQLVCGDETSDCTQMYGDNC